MRNAARFVGRNWGPPRAGGWGGVRRVRYIATHLTDAPILSNVTSNGRALRDAPRAGPGSEEAQGGVTVGRVNVEPGLNPRAPPAPSSAAESP